jgi:signal transduction histidine kinase
VGTSANISQIFFPEASLLVYEFLRKCEYGTIGIISVSFLAYTARVFDVTWVRPYVRPAMMASIGFLALVLFNKAPLYADLIGWIAAFNLFVIGLALVLFIQAVRARKEGARPYLIGGLGLIGTLVFDSLIGLGYSSSSHFFTPLGFGFFFCLQGAALSQVVRKAQREQFKAETDLRYEVHSRVTMVSDLAHRTNNPLNFVAMSLGSLRHEVGKLAWMMDTIFSSQDESDTDAQEFHRLYRDHMGQIKRAMDTMEQGVQRATQSISDIRSLSGVDGYRRERLDMLSLFYSVRSRLEEVLTPTEYGHLKLEFFDVERWSAAGNRIALIVALEHVLSVWLRGRAAPLIVEVRLECLPHEGLRLVLKSQVAEEKQNLSSDMGDEISYLLRPFGSTWVMDPRRKWIAIGLSS